MVLYTIEGGSPDITFLGTTFWFHMAPFVLRMYLPHFQARRVRRAPVSVGILHLQKSFLLHDDSVADCVMLQRLKKPLWFHTGSALFLATKSGSKMLR